jgi:alpha-mannosidase
MWRCKRLQNTACAKAAKRIGEILAAERPFIVKRRQLLKHLGVLTGGLVYSKGAWPQSSSSARSEPAVNLATPIRALVRRDGKLLQPVQISPRPGTQGVVVTKIDGVEVDRRNPSGVAGPFEVYFEPSPQTRSLLISVEANNIALTETVSVKPARKVLVYVLPHSHHDLGYTDLQALVEEKQMQNITLAMELANKTASYPEGARFIWNLEVLWGCDFFVQRRSEAERKALIEAVRKGQISPQGSYANELTGLCRPEELLRLFKYGTQLGEQCGIKVDSAMMSDVPGYSWGTVTAMSQAGIRYFSGAPNFFDRIGTFMEVWQDRPFWWVSPSGREKILMWIPWTGYALSHITSTKSSTLTTSPTSAGQAMEITPLPILRSAISFATGMPSTSGLVSQSRLPVRRFPPLKKDAAISCPPIAAT